jgi:hypothetical protein
MRAPTTRAVMSAPEPGPKPTNTRIGRLGKSCACALAAPASAALIRIAPVSAAPTS